MIHVERSQVPIPAVLTDAKKGGMKETLRAIKFYQDQLSACFFGRPFDQLQQAEKEQVTNFARLQMTAAGGSSPTALLQPLAGKNFGFKSYTIDEVKQALHTLFHGKCAYCESRFATTQPMDVEHWRPKGGFVDENDPDLEKLVWPGYFWLAADWNNLLPSCIDCNRRRNQVVYSQQKPLRLGKESQFPVVDESKRWRYPDQANEEEPLLLSPCAEKEEDWPERHLRFNEDAVLLPRPDPQDATRPSPKATASIRVYALNRTELVLARQERLRLLEYHKQTILRLTELLQLMADRPDANPDELAIVEDLLAFEFASLERYTKPDQPYALLARQFIEAFEKELKEPAPANTG